ncbi:hypothetical protein ABZP36_004101 [Zizania latifolia]
MAITDASTCYRAAKPRTVLPCPAPRAPLPQPRPAPCCRAPRPAPRAPLPQPRPAPPPRVALRCRRPAPSRLRASRSTAARFPLLSSPLPASAASVSVSDLS